jgi:hypothetical protein
MYTYIGVLYPLVRLRVVLRVAALFGVRRRRVVQLLVAVVLARVRSILL